MPRACHARDLSPEYIYNSPRLSTAFKSTLRDQNILGLLVSVFQSVKDRNGWPRASQRCPKMYFPSFSCFILGVVIAYCTRLSLLVQAASVKCKNNSSMYEHCGDYPDGVHDLHCFGKPRLIGSVKDWQCVWTPGNHTAKKTYALIIRQETRKTCQMYSSNISVISGIKLYEKYDMTAHIYEETGPRNCTRAFFKGSPLKLVQCGPPREVTFSRHSSQLEVNMSWRPADMKVIQQYSLRYKALGTEVWIDHPAVQKSPVRSQVVQRCAVGNLNSSLAYEVQVHCVQSEKCPKCPWSEIYTVPPELTARPVILKLEDVDAAQRQGQRLLSLTWKFPATELVEGYNVIVGKASDAAARQSISTARPEIRLMLSYSAYCVNITAFNSASTSPALSQTVLPREDMGNMGAGRLNVAFNSNTSFTISWRDALIKNYSCFSVEWRRTGHEAAHKSFFEKTNNYKVISFEKDPLEPYERYSFTLHTRPNKEPCNMRRVNNSESTYGITQSYFIEGTPISAPANISSCNATLNSVVLVWSSVPEDDIRGFLLGYTIHYAEHPQKGTDTERNVTVDPGSDSHKLEDLKSGTTYLVKMSAFTRAGAGVQSTASIFETATQGYLTLSGAVILFVVVATVLIFGSPLLKRAKRILWPNIPNPQNSNAMQKIEASCVLELLDSVSTQRLEDWDAASLHIVEREAEATPAGSLRSVSPNLLHSTDTEGDSDSEPPSPGVNRDSFRTHTGNAIGLLSGGTAAASSDAQQSACPSSSDYTTMEMFQQAMPQSIPAVSQATALRLEDTGSTVTRSGMDYVRQFSTSPVESGEDSSTFF